MTNIVSMLVQKLLLTIICYKFAVYQHFNFYFFGIDLVMQPPNNLILPSKSE